MKKRITVLLGAGAMVEATGVSTKTITDAVYASCKDYKLSDGTEVLRRFASDFEASIMSDNRKANFEDLFDILENSVDYQRMSINNSAAVILSELKPCYQELKADDKLYLYGMKRDFLKAINALVGKYDTQYDTKSQWMRVFYENLIDREDCVLDVFNLNYDTWMERILPDYVDGFEDIKEIDGYSFKRFRAQNYLNSGDHHTISHLHGQIAFEEADFRVSDINTFAFEEQGYTLYKYPSFDAAEDVRRRHFRSDDTSQSGHNIFLSNIITGRMKTDKMIWSPMQIYMYGLIKALMENDELLIIGYGFGDQYINSLLFKYIGAHKKKHIRIITYTDTKMFERDVCITGDPFTISKESIFVKCAMKSERWCSPFRRNLDGRFVSEDGETEIYLNGFKDFCERYIAGEFADKNGGNMGGDL